MLKSRQGINLPILLSQYWYSKHSNLNFVVDLNHYLFEGYVLSKPGVFVMGKVVEIDGEPTFFIRFAYGNLKELRKHALEGIKWIAFCRNNQGNVRKYSVDRVCELSNLDTLTSPIFSMNTELEDGQLLPV